MTHRALRIRHYIGTIVAACLVGGLLLAFELAYLFQSLERRSLDLRGRTEVLDSVQTLHGSVDGWLRDMRASLGDANLMRGVEKRLDELLLRIDGASKALGDAVPTEKLAELRAQLQLMPEGAQLILKAMPGSAVFNERRAKVVGKLDDVDALARENFEGVESTLHARLGASLTDLEADRGEVWRTVAYSVAAYALLVLVLWRWVVLRLLRPLQTLTREARMTLNAEATFRLQPAGPHEVRLLTESLSTLVESLVGARSNLEEKVKERTLELERANRAKNEFLANMSHEIRTPMTAILGYAELCLALDIPETDRRRYAEIIHVNGEHLLSVINDILDVSKIEAGRMTVEPTLCSPFDAVAEVRALMEVRASEKGLELEVECTNPIPELVRTDPTRLRQILLNLVNNAIKFTEKGRVVLRFGTEGESGAERIVFAVEDTGVGLSPEQQERVFRPFVQADTSTTRKYGGSGLGLTISQTLARLLGGDLTCQSEVGRGSTFRVTIDPGPLEGVRRLDHFPAGAVREPRRSLPVLGPGQDLRGRVLLADDVAVNRRLISTILLRAGIRVDEAENGRIALEKALAARDAGQAFDLVFMDMQMPEMDGYEATRGLRQAGYMRPIVALTSHSMSGERQRCLEAGCDDYMTKPVDRLVLLQVLTRFLPSEAPEQHQAA